MLVCGLSHFRVSFVAQTHPLLPLFFLPVWLLVAEVSFSPLLPAPCPPKRTPSPSQSAPCHSAVLSPGDSQSPLPPSLFFAISSHGSWRMALLSTNFLAVL